ncbi:MAG: UDP-N-acetylmuramoyl-L-alanine--D-glutamate ligase [Lautropia sp.]|nr:UDP-N-acetylmuramoyl-L-alanine--D-glutamate ligase [Lautropia sp.]
MIELQHKKAAVIGLGESGLAMARWLVRAGADVTVFDDRAEPPALSMLQAELPVARFCQRALDADLLDEVQGIDLLAWSPGVSIVTGRGAALHVAAREAGVPVYGELDFFNAEIQRQREAGENTAVVGITGTNGKTTVTRLTAFLANEAGVEAEVAGNISPSMLDALIRRLDDEDGRMPALWVLELSSFQLAVAAAPLACRAATVLNITNDHLDWHGTMKHYRDAKCRIYEGAELRVINLDDPLTDPDRLAPWDVQPVPEAVPEPLKGRARKKVEAPPPPPLPRTVFSLNTPHTAPAFGVVREGGLAWLTEALPEDTGQPSRRRKAQEEAANVVLNRLMPADALRLQGGHNHANVLAALALLRACGVPMAAMLHGLRAFVPDDHRCAPVAIIRDVEYINDSKGTNIGATVAALTGLGRRTVLIAGGVGKDQDFSELAPAVAAYARAVVLIGRDAPILRAALDEAGVPQVDATDLPDAVRQAAGLAQSGDVVLLSPACASFDMFKGYDDRGNQFAEAVRAYAEEVGQPC